MNTKIYYAIYAFYIVVMAFEETIHAATIWAGPAETKDGCLAFKLTDGTEGANPDVLKLECIKEVVEKKEKSGWLKGASSKKSKGSSYTRLNTESVTLTLQFNTSFDQVCQIILPNDLSEYTSCTFTLKYGGATIETDQAKELVENIVSNQRGRLAYVKLRNVGDGIKFKDYEYMRRRVFP